MNWTPASGREKHFHIMSLAQSSGKWMPEGNRGGQKEAPRHLPGKTRTRCCPLCLLSAPISGPVRVFFLRQFTQKWRQKIKISKNVFRQAALS